MAMFFHSFISIQPLGRFGRNQSSVRWPVWLWHAASWAIFLGVGCHYFPPLLDVPPFAARCLHVRNYARDPNSQRWNCGRECCPVIFAEMTTSTPFRDLLHAANLRHGTDGFTSPPKEGVLRNFFALKNPKASAGFEPANLGTEGQHANPSPYDEYIYQLWYISYGM